MDKIEEKLWKRVGRYGWLFRIVPFIRFAAVCNNLAFGVVTDKSDVDIFVVAKKRRLYVAWAFANFLTRFFGVRTYGEKIAGRFCLSFMVDEGAVGFSRVAVKNDIYFANWIYHLVPVIDRGIGSRIEAKNKWILPIIKKGSFAFDRSKVKKDFFLLYLVRKFFEILMFGPVGNLFEAIFRSLAFRRLRKRKGSILLNDMVKLHENDRRVAFRELYLKSGNGDFVAFLRTLPKN
ncbi:MAG: hypothetical protein WC604_00545 [Candidatus Gracilibacteria bacterium]